MASSSATSNAAMNGAGPALERVAIVGCGLVGRSWSIVFARSDAHVRLFDATEGAAEAALEKVRQSLQELEGFGLMRDHREAASRITVAPSIEVAVEGADWIHRVEARGVHNT